MWEGKVKVKWGATGLLVGKRPQTNRRCVKVKWRHSKHSLSSGPKSTKGYWRVMHLNWPYLLLEVWNRRGGHQKRRPWAVDGTINVKPPGLSWCLIIASRRQHWRSLEMIQFLNTVRFYWLLNNFEFPIAFYWLRCIALKFQSFTLKKHKESKKPGHVEYKSYVPVSVSTLQPFYCTSTLNRHRCSLEWYAEIDTTVQNRIDIGFLVGHPIESKKFAGFALLLFFLW